MAEDTLGKLAAGTACTVRQQGWKKFVQTTRGASNLSDGVSELPHKAARLLEHLRRRGANIITATAPWGVERCDDAMQRGPHQSAHDEREFVFEEIMDFCQQGYWAVLPYSYVRNWTNLRVSPLGVVPQLDRRPRLIVDYSFSGVNDETVQLAPKEAIQFGRALQRVIAKVVHADPRYGPVYMSKIDVADGFYRVWLQIADIPILGVALPTTPGQPPLVAFPLALPMGWVESPPYFTTLTETACDLANTELRGRNSKRPRNTVHRLEQVAATPPSDTVEVQGKCEATRRDTRRGHRQGRPPVAAVDVYVDDFLLLAQTEHQRERVLRTTLHAIDDVFRPLSPSDPEIRKEPASVKKMLKGDACWATQKRLLGWDINTETSTLNLPPHRLERLYTLLDMIRPPRKRIAIKIWHKLLGELRSMAPALPGARGLFSVLQDSLSKADRNRVRITQHVWDVIDDFTAIADALRQRPTRLQELVPTAPTFIGASDACRDGMGGVWFHATDRSQPPLLWRQPFTTAIQNALVTAENPRGDISISDLELMALIAHKDVLANHADIAEQTIWMATDNRAALSWSNKGSATSTAARAFLLCYNALHQRHYRYVTTHNHIAGKANVMADDASRLWQLSDDAIISHFNTLYLQALPWRMLPLHLSTNSELTGALFRRRHKSVSRLNASPLPRLPGQFGPLSATASVWIPTNCHQTQSPSSKSSHNGSVPVPLPQAVNPSGLVMWKIPSVPWARRMPGWGPRTLA